MTSGTGEGVHRQRGRGTEHTNHATDQRRQPGDLVGQQERLVAAQRGRRAHPDVPVAPQAAAQPEQTDGGEGHTDDQDEN